MWFLLHHILNEPSSTFLAAWTIRSLVYINFSSFLNFQTHTLPRDSTSSVIKLSSLHPSLSYLPPSSPFPPPPSLLTCPEGPQEEQDDLFLLMSHPSCYPVSLRTSSLLANLQILAHQGYVSAVTACIINDSHYTNISLGLLTTICQNESVQPCFLMRPHSVHENFGMGRCQCSE